TSWYQLQGNSSSGQFGTFTNALSTANGINQGIVNNQVIPGCVKQGDVTATSAVGGLVRFSLNLSNLDHSLDSATDFLYLCSRVHGGRTSALFAARFQGGDTGGVGSVDVGDTPCPVATEAVTWGEVKAAYR